MIVVTLLKSPEDWLGAPSVPQVITIGKGESKAAGLKLSDYNYGNNNCTATIDKSFATYDPVTDQVTGVGAGTTQLRLKFQCDNNYAIGEKTFTVNVVNTHALAIPQSDRYTVTVKRNGAELQDGALIYDTDQLTYHIAAAEGCKLFSPSDVTISGAETFPTPVALRAADDGYLLIDNNDDWNAFAQYYGSGDNFRLNADLTGVTTMVGATEQTPFKAIFDGARHTLNVDLTNDQAFTAPFRFVQGATIKDLNVTGSVHQTGQGGALYHASGLTGRADGVTLERCISSVGIRFDVSGDMHTGGLVGHAVRSTITINDCAFTGSITEQPGRNASVGGLIAWGESDFKAVIKNSYVDQTLNGITEQNNLVRANNWKPDGSTFENCFYTLPTANTTDWDPEPATKVTKEQMQDGSVVYLLQKAHADNLVWGQTITGDAKDAHPVLTDNADKRVFKASFKFGDEEKAVSYANAGTPFTIPTLDKDYSVDYDNTPATADLDIALRQRTQDGYNLIASKTDWDNFVKNYDGTGNYRLTNDIEDITTMVGSAEKPFSGTFDGGNHTITVNYYYDNDEANVGPFRYIQDATIKNLTVAGTITTTAATNGSGGLVASAYGNNTIDHCVSKAKISWNGSSVNDVTNGGIVGRIVGSAKVTFNNCMFIGSMSSVNGYSFGGFVGYTDDGGSAEINNCLVAADFNIRTTPDAQYGNAAFSRVNTGNNPGRIAVNNSYYRTFGSNQVLQGTAVTDEQLANGAVAFSLQGNAQTMVWGQTLSGEHIDQLPVYTENEGKRVYKASYRFNGIEKAASYANAGMTFPAVDIIGYNYTAETKTADGNISIPLTPIQRYIDIASKEDWDKFTQNHGEANYRLTADITVNTMVGSADKPFTGTFDGQGHTLTVDYNVNEQFVAPFRVISGATISNLHTAGNIQSNQQFCGGIVGQVINNASYISGCRSSVNLTWQGIRNTDMTWGGILGIANAQTNIDNCLFDGGLLQPDNFSANSRAYNTGGFVGWSAQSVSIKNSLMAGNIQSNSADWISFSNATFARGNNVSVEKSYWIPEKVENNHRRYTLQGTTISINDARLKSGGVVRELQGTQSTQHWGQVVGEETGNDDLPIPTNDAAKQVFKATFTAGDDIVFAAYANKDKPFNLSGRFASLHGNQPATKDVSYEIFTLDKDGYVDIKDSADWNTLALCTSLQGKYLLTNDISVNTMIPSFNGTFDGQGHTLTVDYNANEERVSPFRYINGANISNLRVAGTITSSKGPGSTGGLAGEATGAASTFTNCESAVNLTFTGGGDATFAGFLGRANADGGVTFNSCAFTGSINAANGHSVAGFVGWIEGNKQVAINNSLSAGTITAQNGGGTGNAPFARNAGNSTVISSYYRDFANITDGYRRGTLASDSLLKSGEVAYALQNAQAVQYWGQTTGTDSLPLFTTDTNKHVYEAGFTVNDEVSFTTYATKGQIFPMPYLGTSVTYLNVSKANDVTATEDTKIPYDNNVTLKLPKGDNYTVTAKLGDKPLNNGDVISGSEALTFQVTPVGNYVVISGNDQTMRAANGGTFAPFEEPLLMASEDGYGLISSKEDWDTFAKNVTSGKFKLTKDIDGITTMVGSAKKPFTGTFDGQGHTLTVNYNVNEQYVAPFRVISGATISNLHTAGNIQSGQQFCGGIVGQVINNVSYISGCRSSVNLNWQGKSDADMTWGGIIGIANAQTNIENCMFDGGLLQPSYYWVNSRGFSTGGFVGWSAQSVSIKNSLMAGSIQSTAWNVNLFTNATFARGNNVSVENSYWIPEKVENNHIRYTHQGTAISINDQRLKNGEFARELQGTQADLHWGQTIGRETGNDDLPVPTTDAAKRLYMAAFTDGTDTICIHFANKGMQFPVKGKFAELCENKPADQDTTVQAFTTDADGYVLINDADDWDAIALGRFIQHKLRLAKDISVTSMLPSFASTFDGQGNTLTVDYTNATGELRVAPFRTINGATFTNLRIAGSISANASPGMAAGLAGNAEGQPSTFTNCESAVNLTFTGNGDATHGGFLGRAQTQVTFNNCAFTGSMTAANGYCVGGFVGWAEQPVTVNNSLVAGDIKVKPANNTTSGNAAFVRNPGQLTIKDSYILPYEAMEVFQGTSIDSTQLKSGMAAYALQGTQTGQRWGQTIGTDTKPLFSTAAEKHVYKADYMDGEVAAFTTYANKGVVFPKPAMPGNVTYITLKDVETVVAAQDTIIPYSTDMTLKLPQGENYTVTATLGDQPIENGGQIANSGALTFTITPADNYMLLTESVQTMREAEGNTFAPFYEPVMLKAKDGYGEIATKDDWNTFVEYGSDLNFRLTADIDDVTMMAGTESRPFTGTFDGQGHTLTVNLNYGGQMVAPFSWVKGATIKHLRTAGTVTANNFHASGLVGRSYGVTIDNCEVDVDVQYTQRGDAHNGGFVGHGGDDAVTITNSAFNGKFSSPNNQSFYGVGGFVGWGGTNVTIKNCYAHYQMGQGCQWYYPFIYKSDGVKSLTLENCYAANAEYGRGGAFDRGNENCTQVTRSQVESGEMAYKLQGTQESQIWGQAVGTDKMPQLTSDAAKRILENVYDDDSKIYDNCVVISENKGNMSVISANNTVKGNVKLVRKFAEGWNTIVLPFSLTTEEVNEAFGDDTEVAYFTNDKLNTIELNTKPDTKDIPANQPVLIRPSKSVDEIGDLTFTDKTIASVEEAKVVGVNGINFVGSYDASYTVKPGEYFISGTYLWKSEGNSTIKATRGYFTVPQSAASAKIMLRINDDTTTGISSVESEESGVMSNGSGVFTLSGQKVADSLEEARKLNLKQGVYIVNGKKIVIK